MSSAKDRYERTYRLRIVDLQAASSAAISPIRRIYGTEEDKSTKLFDNLAVGIFTRTLKEVLGRSQGIRPPNAWRNGRGLLEWWKLRCTETFIQAHSILTDLERDMRITAEVFTMRIDEVDGNGANWNSTELEGYSGGWTYDDNQDPALISTASRNVMRFENPIFACSCWQFCRLWLMQRKGSVHMLSTRAKLQV